jgi:hypothetical protein
MKKPINPIAARVEVLPGRRLEAKWQQNLETVGGNYDRRNWDEVFNAPQWSSKFNAGNTGNIIQNARLGIYGKPKENE